MRQLDKLIVVPGHAAFRDSVEAVPDNLMDSRYWALQSFQQGEPPFYIEHIKKGVELLDRDESSLLLFSGGRTREEAGHWSEAGTYQAIAEYHHFWTDGTVAAKLMARTALEAYARDSFENLKFSLCRFYDLQGKYPDHVTVVGWLFKAARFKLHRDTLGIAPENFSYVGCNNPDDLSGAMKGEQRTLLDFQADPMGELQPLRDKRKTRNPFDEQPPYENNPPIVMN